jgi:RNA recognition motif-containing protein
MTKIFISGLPADADEVELVKLFLPFGEVNTIEIVKDKRTGKSKGIAYLDLHKYEAAQEAVNSLDGCRFGQSTLSVKIAAGKAERQEAPANPGGHAKYLKIERSAIPLKKKRPRLNK